MAKKTAAIIVFGDIGRSPRMQNHALEFTKNTDYYVYLIGYLENAPHDKIKLNKDIELIGLSNNLIDKLKKLPKQFYMLYAILRIFIQILQILYIFLFKIKTPDFILVQNPPSIPVLSTIYMVCLLKNIYFLVDFHNYGFTILELGVKNRFILKIAKMYEKLFGKLSDYSFCVSQAMQKDLKIQWGIDSTVLYDKANSEMFQPISIEEKHHLLKKLKFDKNSSQTIITEQLSNKFQYREKRDILLISSTSWTKDENFGIVLDALNLYDKKAKLQSQRCYFPKLFMIITGKGPEKQFYINEINKMKTEWQFIQVETLWLEAEQYPKLLATADLGICLHYSSSGLDLPMKVVDMFGCCLPVLAIDYQCIGELIQHKKNGQIFQDSKQLADQIIELFENFPKNQFVLNQYSQNLDSFKQISWHIEWVNQVLPIIQKISNNPKPKNHTLIIVITFIMIFLIFY